MKKTLAALLLAPLLLTGHVASAQTLSLPSFSEPPTIPVPIHIEGWTVIKAIGATTMYVPVDQDVEKTPDQPDWRTFPILLNDTDIAPKSLIMTVTIDCKNESMRQDRFDVYSEVNGKGEIVRSETPELKPFLPINDHLDSTHQVFDLFCPAH